MRRQTQLALRQAASGVTFWSPFNSVDNNPNPAKVLDTIEPGGGVPAAVVVTSTATK
jgi:hypothetical protein